MMFNFILYRVMKDEILLNVQWLVHLQKIIRQQNIQLIRYISLHEGIPLSKLKKNLQQFYAISDAL